MSLLDKIYSPDSLKKMNLPQLNMLAKDIRKRMIHTVSQNGGHLASNLGVVELTVALHHCLNSPTDKIVWDVGHQCYPHKLLTGRAHNFDTLRQFGGLAGFIKSDESPHDSFDVGHSSTSISAALGMAVARDLQGQNHKVVAVIGDGSLTSGLALEGLNNAGRADCGLIVVLNDNAMSISENVGALSRHLSDLRTAPRYINAKSDVLKFLESVPFAGNIAKNIMEMTKAQLRYLLTQGVLFEELGFKYYGPIDGHDLGQLINTFDNVKVLKRPVLVHVKTEKGRGYEPARRWPKRFHGVEPFDISSGRPLNSQKHPTYTDVFAKIILEIGKTNSKIVAITASMPDGTGLSGFQRHLPKRFFDVGIAEGHAVTYAAGLAKCGLQPIVAVYSTFLQRAYDQILHDVCIQKLPVVFAIDRAGLVGGDGATHQGVFDLSYLMHMPNMTVFAPTSGDELCKMLEMAFSLNAPVAIRFPKDSACHSLPEINGKNVAIVAAGAMYKVAHNVCESLHAQGISVELLNPRTVKPISTALLNKLTDYQHVFSLEDNALIGGFGQSLLFEMQQRGITPLNFRAFGVPDQFIPTGTRQELLGLLKLDADSIFAQIMEIIANGNPS